MDHKNKSSRAPLYEALLAYRDSKQRSFHAGHEWQAYNSGRAGSRAIYSWDSVDEEATSTE